MPDSNQNEPKKNSELTHGISKGKSTVQASRLQSKRKAPRSSRGKPKDLHPDSPREHPQVTQDPSRTPLHGNNGGELHVQREGDKETREGGLLVEQVHSSESGSQDRGGSSSADQGTIPATDSNSSPANLSFDEQVKRLRDPVYFARAFCLRGLDEWQVRLLEDARTPGRTALRGANGIGKTVIIAVLILFFLSTIKNCRVVIVSGVFRQLKMMVDHLSSLMNNFPGWQILRGSHEMINPVGNKAVWFSTDSPGAAEGQHSVVEAVDLDEIVDNLNGIGNQAKASQSCLILIRDECKTIPDRVKEATDTFGANWTFDLSNPGASSGWFYDIFVRLGHIYRLHHVTAHMSSYITPQYISEFEQIHTKESARYKNAIEAEFSDAGLKNILTMDHWDNCYKNPPPWQHSNVNVGGLDLSAAKKGGDECVLQWRKGNKFQEPIIFTGYKNESDLITDVLIKIKEHNITHVFADNGGMGSTMITFMEKALIGTAITIYRVDFGGRCISTIQHNYKSRGTEMYFAFAEKVQMRQFILPKDPETRSQIISRETETFGDGMIRLVPKSDLPKSPDRADAIVLCAQEPAGPKVYRTFDWDDNEKGGRGRAEIPEYAKTADGFDLGG